jgi:RNA polymerase sigma-70 factor (ECF subfamily)
LRYTITLIGNKDKAEDIVQETFIKAYVNLHSFDTKKKFSSWLYRIAHNEAINNIRKYRREVSLEENELFVNKIASSQNVSKEVIDNEKALEIGRCIQKLSIKYSEPLELFYIGEKTYEEISDILRLPISTVGVRINRAKQMVKKICTNLEGKL